MKALHHLTSCRPARPRPRWPAAAMLACAAGLAPATSWAQAADSAWQRCRLMPDPAARLACYDSLVPAPGPAAAPAANPVERFGLEEKQALAGAADEITSTLPGVFEGWQSSTRFQLANGQTWQVSDGSRATFNANDPKVTIRRGVFGVFYLQVEGLNKVVKVRRLQ